MFANEVLHDKKYNLYTDGKDKILEKIKKVMYDGETNCLDYISNPQTDIIVYLTDAKVFEKTVLNNFSKKCYVINSLPYTFDKTSDTHTYLNLNASKIDDIVAVVKKGLEIKNLVYNQSNLLLQNPNENEVKIYGYVYNGSSYLGNVNGS